MNKSICGSILTKYEAEVLSQNGVQKFELILTVSDMRQKDVGKGIGRIDEELMKQLGSEPSGIVILFGTRKTSVIAWPCYQEDKGKAMIRIDGFSRKNAGVVIGETVKVSRAEVKTALKMLLAPVDMRLNVDQDFTNFVKNRLMERTFFEGDTTLVMMLGHALPFYIVRTDPHADCVRIIKETSLMISNEPIGERPQAKTVTDVQTFIRHNWLRVVSSRTKAERVTFSISGTNKEDENEGKILEQARNMVDTSWSSVDVLVNFYTNKGELIGTLPWLTLDEFGNIKAVYPEIRFPTEPRYPELGSASVRSDTGITTSQMRRCFKIGVEKCPKEVKLSPKAVFVAMPFRPNFQDFYKYAIRPALEDMGFKIWKADEKIDNIDIMCKMCQGIQECSYVVANISDWNPNVLFEIGLAYGIGKNVVMIKDRKESVPVDLKGLEYIDYETIDDLKRNLIAFFKSMREDLKDQE